VSLTVVLKNSQQKDNFKKNESRFILKYNAFFHLMALHQQTGIRHAGNFFLLCKFMKITFFILR